VKPLLERNRNGSALIGVVILGMLVGATAIGLFRLSQHHVFQEGQRQARMNAFYHAENAFLEGVQRIAESAPNQFRGAYGLHDQNSPLDLPYVPGAEVGALTLTIADDPLGQPDNYQVTASCTVNGKTRAIQGLVRKDPPSQVFDYEYFLNNWGWWWGNGIYGQGDQRSNWDFDFRNTPTVNGDIFANGTVESNQTPVDPFSGVTPFTGLAGADPFSYVHTGASRVKMPSLLDFSVYEGQADGAVVIDGVTAVDMIHGTSDTPRGIYLKGTTDKPIEINGSVVVHGDVVLDGIITGQGTLYVGGNLYLANNTTYKNGPDFSVNPGTMTGSTQETWVDDNMDKDLVAFAVRESVFGGQVNSTDWYNTCYNNGTYGLRVVGNEATLGEDGIAHTPDDGVPYAPDGSGGLTAWNDVDEDGVVDGFYNYDNDVKMTSSRIAMIDGYPVDTSGNPVSYDSISSANITTVTGIIYTNHAYSLRTQSGPDYVNGSVICRDEAIIFSSKISFRYDPRVHSDYQQKHFEGDPNRIIDLGLPVRERARILDRYECYPNA
jgi:hypothetical protein